jgi:hypothetical protein
MFIFVMFYLSLFLFLKYIFYMSCICSDLYFADQYKRRNIFVKSVAILVGDVYVCSLSEKFTVDEYDR